MSRRKVTLVQIKKIIELTNAEDPWYSRGEIAEKVGVSKNTVYLYQKRYDLL